MSTVSTPAPKPDVPADRKALATRLYKLIWGEGGFPYDESIELYATAAEKLHLAATPAVLDEEAIRADERARVRALPPEQWPEVLGACPTCLGRRVIQTWCADSQCGDGTWDHDCGDGEKPCPACTSPANSSPKPPNASSVSLLDSLAMLHLNLAHDAVKCGNMNQPGAASAYRDAAARLARCCLPDPDACGKCGHTVHDTRCGKITYESHAMTSTIRTCGCEWGLDEESRKPDPNLTAAFKRHAAVSQPGKPGFAGGGTDTAPPVAPPAAASVSMAPGSPIPESSIGPGPAGATPQSAVTTSAPVAPKQDGMSAVKAPFTWSAEQRARLTPGSTVDMYFNDGTKMRLEFKTANGPIGASLRCLPPEIGNIEATLAELDPDSVQKPVAQGSPRCQSPDCEPGCGDEPVFRCTECKLELCDLCGDRHHHEGKGNTVKALKSAASDSIATPPAPRTTVSGEQIRRFRELVSTFTPIPDDAGGWTVRADEAAAILSIEGARADASKTETLLREVAQWSDMTSLWPLSPLFEKVRAHIRELDVSPAVSRSEAVPPPGNPPSFTVGGNPDPQFPQPSATPLPAVPQSGKVPTWHYIVGGDYGSFTCDVSSISGAQLRCKIPNVDPRYILIWIREDRTTQDIFDATAVPLSDDFAKPTQFFLLPPVWPDVKRKDDPEPRNYGEIRRGDPPVAPPTGAGPKCACGHPIHFVRCGISVVDVGGPSGSRTYSSAHGCFCPGTVAPPAERAHQTREQPEHKHVWEVWTDSAVDMDTGLKCSSCTTAYTNAQMSDMAYTRLDKLGIDTLINPTTNSGYRYAAAAPKPVLSPTQREEVGRIALTQVNAILGNVFQTRPGDSHRTAFLRTFRELAGKGA